MGSKTYFHNSRVVGSLATSTGVVVSLRPQGYYSIPEGLVVGYMANMVQCNPPMSKRNEVVDLAKLAGYVEAVTERQENAAKAALESAASDVPERVEGTQRPFRSAVSVTPVTAAGEEKTPAKFRLGRPKKDRE